MPDISVGCRPLVNETEFVELLRATERAFHQSDVKRLAEQKQAQWYYAVCATRIESCRTLVIGFNWGARKGENYTPQDMIPEDNFLDLAEKGWLGSMVRILPFLQRYLDNEVLHSLGQSNYCFFRSESQQQISPRDIDLCKPLFHKFLEIVHPSRILCFSSLLRKHLHDTDSIADILQSDPIAFKRGNRNSNFIAEKALFRISKESVPILFLPHPNYPMSIMARKRAWQFCLH